MDFNDKNNTPKTPFDNLISNPTLDIMKLMIPYLPLDNQPTFALYIKFMELQATMKFFKNHPFGVLACEVDANGSDNPFDSSNIFSALRPYIPAENANQIDNIMNMMNMMNMMKQMQAMNEASGDDQSMDFLKSMLSPEQQDMFETFNQMAQMAEEAEEASDSCGQSPTDNSTHQ